MNSPSVKGINNRTALCRDHYDTSWTHELVRGLECERMLLTYFG
jgi:hypothetical protein